MESIHQGAQLVNKVEAYLVEMKNQRALKLVEGKNVLGRGKPKYFIKNRKKHIHWILVQHEKWEL
jgi:hypothetical protein